MTNINISLNLPPNYGVELLRRQLTDYANILISRTKQSSEVDDRIELTSEMLLAAQIAEKEYAEGKCHNESDFREQLLDRFVSSRPSVPAISEEDIMNEVKSVRYSKE
jgi:hypothetical protein